LLPASLRSRSQRRETRSLAAVASVAFVLPHGFAFISQRGNQIVWSVAILARVASVEMGHR